ncbi:hypothetical protein HRI_000467400 [Hibiscus trionum]|uniref:Uncharacterized protein n=1 Tax=Hibiscus trionum TaxID=183268 RepID=A0A9W7H021_HIBTR|nr:hypothetical protein HRI_000467400 [Hibiscus trionum]
MPSNIASATPNNIALEIPDNIASEMPDKDTVENKKASEGPDSTPQINFPCKERIEHILLPLSFPQRLKRKKQEYQFKKFLDILKQVHINIPLVEAIEQMSNYAKFLKDIVSKRTRIGEFETIPETEV